MNRLCLSVLVPVYNEQATIACLLDRLATADCDEVIIVDDGSTDATAEVIRRWIDECGDGESVVYLGHEKNQGKGAAIRTGLAAVTADLVVIQDADLEYDPAEFGTLVEPIAAGRADVVYGSRYLGPLTRLPWTPNRVCVYVLNLLVLILYGRRVTDEATCYKVFRTTDLRRMNLRCEHFEFCPEVTAKSCRLGLRIQEVPISYHPRTAQQGKKIGWRDGIHAIATLFRWRVMPMRPAVSPERLLTQSRSAASSYEPIDSVAGTAELLSRGLSARPGER